jgi:hypothetical protein
MGLERYRGVEIRECEEAVPAEDDAVIEETADEQVAGDVLVGEAAL